MRAMGRWFVGVVLALLVGGLPLEAGLRILHISPDSILIEVQHAPDLFPISGDDALGFGFSEQELQILTEGSPPRIRRRVLRYDTLRERKSFRYVRDVMVGWVEEEWVEGPPPSPIQILPVKGSGLETGWRIRFSPEWHVLSAKALSYTSVEWVTLSGAKISLPPREDFHRMPHSAKGRFPEEQEIGKAALPRKRRLKIWVHAEGIYRLTVRQMLSAGFDMRRVNPVYLRLQNRGRDVPMRLLGQEDGRWDGDDAIEFWGEPLWEFQPNGERRLDPFAISNVYWLEVSDRPGLRMGQEGAIPSGDPRIPDAGRSFLHTEHEEQDRLFDRVPWQLGLNEGDHWFYMQIPAGEKKDLFFAVEELDSSAVQLAGLRIHLRGRSTLFTAQPFEVYLNGHRVLSDAIPNQKQTFEVKPFTPQYLVNGRNILSLANRAGEEELGAILLDWFEIAYPRRYRAIGNALKFKAPPYSAGQTVRFQIEGFTEDRVEIYKGGDRYLYHPKVESYRDTLGRWYRAVFEDRIEDPEAVYFAVTPSAKRFPDSIRVVVTPDLVRAPLSADYVVVVFHDSLGGPLLAPWLALRKAQGLRCLVVPLDTLYDTFSDGIPHPEAIRRFLRHGWTTWSRKPRFLVLVGDGFMDSRRRGHRNNRIPFFHFQTYKYGAAASDHFYACLDEDDLPELAVGRMPVRNRSELRVMIEKIVVYETSPPAPWKNRYLLIGSDRQTQTFGRQSESLIREVLPPALEPVRLYLQGDLTNPYVGGREELYAHLYEGVGLINFRGHGGGAIWADAGLLDLEGVQHIDNPGRLPFVTSMTCFTTDFGAGRQSLGEALVLQPETGAIGFFGASGVGWVYTDYYLLREILGVLVMHPEWTWGEIVAEGKRRFLETNLGDLPLSSVHQYSLLGDPAIRPVFPSRPLGIVLDTPSLSMGDSVRLSLTSPLNEKWISWSEVAADRRGTPIRLDLVEDLSGGIRPLPIQDPRTTGLRVYAWHPEKGTQAHGFVPISIGRPRFDSLAVFPKIPTSRDSLFFKAVIHHTQTIQKAWIRVWKANGQTVRDSLFLKPSPVPPAYAVERGLPPQVPGTVLYASTRIRDEVGNVFFGDTLTVRIPTRPNLDVWDIRLGGEETVHIRVTVRNLGEEAVANAKICVDIPALAYSVEGEIPVPGNQVVETVFPFLSRPGIYTVSTRVRCPPPVIETDTTNNTLLRPLKMDRFAVTPTEGSGGWVGIPHIFECRIPAGGVSRQGVVMVTQDEGQGEANVYAVRLLGGIVPRFPFPIRLYRVGASQTARPYRLEEKGHRWVSTPFVDQDSLFLLEKGMPGFYRLMDVHDQSPPRIEIQVDNQPFVEMAYVPSKARFSILLEDDSGLLTNGESLRIVLDDLPIPAERWFVSDSTVSKTALIRFETVLSPGIHRIQVWARDIHGNGGAIDPISFQVTDRFGIRYLGNHPNPFRRETVFAYLLTGAAERVTLTIYTVSGRPVRRFDAPSLCAPDYHEIAWDGTDEWGEELANGVYFFRLTARKEGMKEEVTGKVAKIR